MSLTFYLSLSQTFFLSVCLCHYLYSIFGTLVYEVILGRWLSQVNLSKSWSSMQNVYNKPNKWNSVLKISQHKIIDLFHILSFIVKRLQLHLNIQSNTEKEEEKERGGGRKRERER